MQVRGGVAAGAGPGRARVSMSVVHESACALLVCGPCAYSFSSRVRGARRAGAGPAHMHVTLKADRGRSIAGAERPFVQARI